MWNISEKKEVSDAFRAPSYLVRRFSAYLSLFMTVVQLPACLDMTYSQLCWRFYVHLDRDQGIVISYVKPKRYWLIFTIVDVE